MDKLHRGCERNLNEGWRPNSCNGTRTDRERHAKIRSTTFIVESLAAKTPVGTELSLCPRPSRDFAGSVALVGLGIYVATRVIPRYTPSNELQDVSI
ncbi:uncharacterized protein GGS22DRAFT_192582 [Annulohypoxylon maeteangense]|uniref:uncharacterized protein n=1 Tax=Annulohypoxylon maeteangense TaxID=1927788 RepID=UPI002008ACC4|nr:uncharacterized protein GGS22DRAFT_192582 [Annulohypoxylon maeteangense]KAI0881095.1 hypothetical protein GGS22DRAFT_192582 [Annulohypoxylon maeteangense]